MSLRASLHTLGCRLNQAETAIIANSLRQAGFQIVDFGEPSDVTVINTCTVTEQADAKCRQAVRKTLRKNPDTFVAVIGCYAQMAVDTISAIDGVDLIIGNEHKMNLVDFLDSGTKLEQPLVVHSPKISREEFTIETVGLYDNATRANLKIQDGCNFVCSFCIIPTARGPARSRKPDDIIKEARALVEMGHRELVLTGVNIGTYAGEGKNFADVLDALENIDGLERIRISSIEPTTIAEQVIRKMAESDKLCNHLHIPIQSGDDGILKAMRRKYTVRDFTEFIEFAHDTVPGIGIGTDVMVGFPGEGREQFINTKKILGDLPISYFHVFTYSDRQGTSSVKMDNKVDPQEKKKRNRILIEQGKRKKTTFYRQHIGSRADVLFEQKDENGYWRGYTTNYMEVKMQSDEDLHNCVRCVQLEEIDGNYLIGRPVG